MNYLSTRGKVPPVSAAEAIAAGVAPDGGLYVPEQIPEIDMQTMSNRAHSYFPQVVETILKAYLPDWSDEVIRSIVGDTYAEDSFGDNPAGVVQLNPYVDREYILHLDQGPTGSYKDYSLRLLPGLIRESARLTGGQSKWLLLAVTSGNTGNAALNSVTDAEDLALMVFFPRGGLTPLQISQLVALTNDSSYVSASPLNFDQLQAELRQCLIDQSLRSTLASHDVGLTTANSLNIARLIPQIAVYFHAYGQLLRQDKITPGESINFVIPAGNFGNALAAWYAAEMGLPVGRLILATNRNRALLDIVKHGRVRPNRQANYTMTPGMDVLMPANIERLLYQIASPPDKYAQYLIDNKDFKLDAADLKRLESRFAVGAIDEEPTIRAIARIYDETDYLVDPHTAAGMDIYERYRQATKDDAKTVFVTVASPLRYAKTVGAALFGERRVQKMSETELTEQVAAEAGLEDELAKWKGEDAGVLPELSAGTMRRTILEQLGVYEPGSPL
ncbi:MAG TPA: hypothetical protein GXZ64_08430 [Clostridiaceae bacterium]|nr:hypothetical protein [Clostridiaceae bacterium]